jgi:nicotinate-nucleotide adenylyltransferase
VPAIGILGGSFDPPHLGHLELARQARRELGLQEVQLMPLHTPHHKPAREEPGPQERLEMCRAAVTGEDGLQVSDLEVRRGAPSYTADTLREIHELHPDAELTFIVGADTAATLPSWHRPDVVLQLAGLAIADRTGASRQSVLEAIENVGGGSAEVPTIRFLSMFPMKVSSSLVRERLAGGLPVVDLVGVPVDTYIRAHGLYGGGR